MLCQVKQSKEWIDLHLAHLDYNSDLTAEQQSSSERLRRTATYILQALVSNSQQHNGRQPLSLRAIVSDLRLVDKGRLPGCIDAEEVPGEAEPTKVQRCVMLVYRTVQQLQADGLVRRCSGINGQLLINRMEMWEWQAANRYIEADTHL